MFSARRVCCIVTGASRGFGRAVALALAEEFTRRSIESTVVLVARSTAGLEETKSQIKALQGDLATCEVRCICGDLGDLTSLQETTKALFDTEQPKDYEHAILVSNAGTIGDVSKFVKDHRDLATVSAYWALNISSPLFLITQFLQVFRGVPCTVVNVSSLAALEPLPSLSLYSIGKAARDMMHSVLAKEEPDMRVLNYAPGPLDTDMFEEICQMAADVKLKEAFNKMKQEENVLSPETSAKKLVIILAEDKFTSGNHIDFFD